MYTINLKVLENELQAIQKACDELESGYQPGITFLVVQKRHHARFFAEDEKDKVIMCIGYIHIIIHVQSYLLEMQLNITTVIHVI